MDRLICICYLEWRDGIGLNDKECYLIVIIDVFFVVIFDSSLLFSIIYFKIDVIKWGGLFCCWFCIKFI